MITKGFYSTAYFIVLSLLFSASVYGQDASSIPTDEGIISQGRTLYNNNCAVCHAIERQLVGPALKNVHERQSVEWLKAFIINSQRVIQSGDQYAVNLYNQYNRTEMPAFDFSDDEVMSILAYIKDESAKEPVQAAASDTGDGSQAQAQTGTAISSGYITVILMALLIVLVLILIVLAVLISVLTKYIKQKTDLDEADEELVSQKVDFGKLVRSPGFVWFASFIFTAIVLKAVIDGLFSIGIQEGYAPAQPIAFSHKLHAGQYEIECQYCHTGVLKGKSANIPSANICMNCHSAIVKVGDSDQPSAEIQKIYDAIENNKPIEWIRVHNLPDLSYFNHAQHVAVGEIECQTCHGPIEEMEIVKQHSNLTMGWCIDCHRQTDVNSMGNAYYDKLVELHESKGKGPMKVADIGGLECAKCHY
ncbi:MAG: c-type cytochrome [Cyclobacteriaceae bacterium]|nr:c-type cytochrome [Cyclobacteriaceae bacterium]